MQRRDRRLSYRQPHKFNCSIEFSCVESHSNPEDPGVKDVVPDGTVTACVLDELQTAFGRPKVAESHMNERQVPVEMGASEFKVKRVYLDL